MYINSFRHVIGAGTKLFSKKSSYSTGRDATAHNNMIAANAIIFNARIRDDSFVLLGNGDGGSHIYGQ
jgi:hypothetical protein